jgi:hypothetical protein
MLNKTNRAILLLNGWCTMKSFVKISVFVILTLFVALPSIRSYARPAASASSYGGTYSDWPTSWMAITGLVDPDDNLSTSKIDFVGNSSYPGAYVANNGEYIFFRIRVDDGSATIFSDTIMILIDQDNDDSPDYAVMWDSRHNDQPNHGLELGIPNDVGPTWATTRMDDLDGDPALKISPPDFGLSNGDGYVRILNGQPTTGFGTTTFVDYAVRWSYLSTETTLGKGQSWGIQLGSIDDATDHSWINYDVSGGRSPTGSLTFPGEISFTPTAIKMVSFEATSGVNGLTIPVSILVLLTLLITVVTVVKSGIMVRGNS